MFRLMNSREPFVLLVPYDRITWAGLSRIIAFAFESEAWILVPVFFGVYTLTVISVSEVGHRILTAAVKVLSEEKRRRREQSSKR